MVELKIITMMRNIVKLVVFAYLVMAGCAANRPFEAQMQQKMMQKAQLAAARMTLPDTSELAKRINTAIDTSTFLKTAVTGVYVSDINGHQLYNRNGDKLFTPASTAKVFTAVAALHYLGSEYKFQTHLYLDARRNVYLKGFGDPSFSTGDLYEMAVHFAQLGLRKVNDIVLDDSYYDTLRLGHGWMWDDDPYPFMARLSALSLDWNIVEVTIRPSKVGSRPKIDVYPVSRFLKIKNEAITTDTGRTRIKVDRALIDNQNWIIVSGNINRNTDKVVKYRNIDNPTLHVGYVFAWMLGELGIKVKGTIRRDTVPSDAQLVYVHGSKPLFEIVADMLKASNNQKAEMLLKAVGAATDTPPGTSAKGIAAVKNMLANEVLGADTLQFRLVDGSGLSRYDLISPKLHVALLRWAFRNRKLMPEFLTAMPVGGVDGTLERRMKWDSGGRHVRAKTGTMSGVSALTGYVWPDGKPPLVFSILMNNFVGSARYTQAVQDEIVRAIYETYALPPDSSNANQQEK